jgi:4-aminobutyrate aminotransferase-like enzyme
MLMETARDHDVAIFVDEVQTFGRTTELFAFQAYGLEDLVEIVSIGKLSQVCATLFRAHLKPQAGLLSQTFTGSTSSIFGGIAIIEALLNGNYYGPSGHISKIHNYFAHKLEDIAARHKNLIKGPFGVGCMVAFTPYEGDTHQATKLAHALFENGVITFIAGSHPTRIRLLLPGGALRFEDIDIIATILEDTLLSQHEAKHVCD